MTCLNCDSSLDDRSGLHCGDLGVGYGEAASAVTHHRVELVEVCDYLLDVLNALALYLCESLDISLVGGNELMKRRIEEADGYGVTAESLKESLKVGLLHRLDLCKSSFALLNGLGTDHLTESTDSRRIEEHMLGTAKSDSLCAEGCCLLSVLGSVGVGAYAHSLILVGKLHDTAEVTAVRVCRNGRDQAIVNVARRAVEGYRIALGVGLACESEALVLLVHLDVSAAGNAAGSHSACNDCRMGGLTAANSEDTL